MTYTLKQLQRAHERVHQEASNAPENPAHADAQAQRTKVMDDLMARMIVYEKRTLDREELEPHVVTMIDHLLRPI